MKVYLKKRKMKEQGETKIRARQKIDELKPYPNKELITIPKPTKLTCRIQNENPEIGYESEKMYYHQTKRPSIDLNLSLEFESRLTS